jgi:1-acyl-sn-glycerol-3-phosphate acyltransferase
MSTQQNSWFDPSYAESLGREVIEPLLEHYFRLKLEGLENVPAPDDERPIIFVANHAGRTFPWDAILLDYALSREWVDKYGWPVAKKPRSLAAPELSATPRLLPYRLSHWWERTGCVDATAANFTRLLKQRQHTIIFPEGIAGIARDFRYRYQLLPFPTTLVRIARRFNARIVPVSIIGSEYFHPFARRVGWLNKIAKWLKLPYLHLSPFSIFLPFCPWLFYSALPVQTTIYFGPALEPQEPSEAFDDWEAVAQNLRQHCQLQLDEARARYERGFDIPGLVKALRRAPEPFWKLLPFYWPRRFIQHARTTAPELFPGLLPDWWFWLPFMGWFNPRPEHETAAVPVSTQEPPTPRLQPVLL